MFCLVLPAPTLTGGFPELRCLSRTTLGFRPSPDYRSGGRAMAVLADAAPCGPVPSRTCKRQWTVRLPAVQQAAAAVSACPCRSRAGVHRAGRLRVAGVRRLRLRSQVGPLMSAGCADLAGTQGRPRNRTPRQCPLDVRPAAGRTAALRRGHGRGAPEQGRDMAIAGGRPSMHAPPVAAVDANRRRRCPRRQHKPRRGRLSRPGCPPHGVLPLAADTAAVSAGASGTAAARRCRPDGWCPPRTPPPAGVRCYRKRSPDRWPLVWCRHCR